MAKLYFKYGAMGSSKTAQALITKFNYEERNMKVWLIKPALDTRDGKETARSRVGLKAPCRAVERAEDLFALFEREASDCDVIIADECQFLTESQVDQLRKIVDEKKIPVMCFGLRADFLCHLFEGSKRLFEVADSIAEIKTICACGSKAIVNARLDGNMRVVTDGEQVMLGGNESYIALCHKCWKQKIKQQKEEAHV
ncbi:MAG: thymidine kinase [Clostridia bacterium]|nr:thymidine kinase [Clostridia bacterium]